MRRKLIAVVAFVASSIVIAAPALPVKALDPISEPEMIAHAVVAPTSPQTSGPAGLVSPYDQVSWGLDRIDQRGNVLDRSFSFAGAGAGVKAYIVDSGVNASHQEFGTRVLDGWSYRSSNSSIVSYHRAVTSQPVDPITGAPAYDVNTGLPLAGATFADPLIRSCGSDTSKQQMNPATYDDLVTNDVVSGAKRYKDTYFTYSADVADKGKLDNDGHGTHVAGTIGGEITGVAKSVTIVPVRVLDSCGSGTITMVHNGLQWILADHQLGEKAVINMSIGFDSSATIIDTDIRELMAEGIVVVAAAGNESRSSCGITPAGTPGTISVGAIDSTTTEAFYSNFGDCVDIFAPGSGIVSSWPKNGSATNTYYLESGTSMASPHVAGVVATQLAGRTITSNTPNEMWNWLKLNSSCDVVTYNNPALAATAQTANRVLNNGSAAGPACKPTTASATAGDRTLAVAWTEPASPNGSVLTGYSATLSPGGQSCSVDVSTLHCDFSGLTNGVAYTATIRAMNAIGASPVGATVTATPLGPPQSVASIAVTTANKSLRVSWSQRSGDGPGITYVATASPGGRSCSTTRTSCMIVGLKNGTAYRVSVSGTNSVGIGISVAANSSSRPGFKVSITSVKMRSRTTLSKIVTTPSKGTKVWREIGACRIVAGRLVAPSKATKCKVILHVARSSAYPAMSTAVVVTVK